MISNKRRTPEMTALATSGRDVIAALLAPQNGNNRLIPRATARELADYLCVGASTAGAVSRIGTSGRDSRVPQMHTLHAVLAASASGEVPSTPYNQDHYQVQPYARALTEMVLSEATPRHDLAIPRGTTDSWKRFVRGTQHGRMPSTPVAVGVLAGQPPDASRVMAHLDLVRHLHPAPQVRSTGLAGLTLVVHSVG